MELQFRRQCTERFCAAELKAIIEPVRFRPEQFYDEPPLVWEINKKKGKRLR